MADLRAVGCLMQAVPLRLSAAHAAHEVLRGDVAAMLTHSVLPIEELVSRGILPRRGLQTAPIAVQFQVRRAEPEVLIDRPDLKITRVDTGAGVAVTLTGLAGVTLVEPDFVFA